MAYSGIPKGTMKQFFASSATSNNGCGPAAVATCLFHYKLLTKASTAVSTVYKRSPPDVAINSSNNFGSTPGHVENICKLHKLRTVRFDGRGGSPDFLMNQLKFHLKKTRPVILLMDNGKLGSSWGGHYIVAYGFDTNYVYCVNMLDRSSQAVDNRQFMSAWHVWFVPSDEFHYSGIATWKA